MNNELAVQIRTKKLAVLILDARLSAGRTKAECAEALGVSGLVYSAYESGARAPSLPELEALAFFLEVPFEHFRGNKSLSESEQAEAPSKKIARSLEIRKSVIGVKLQQAREAAGISLSELSRRSSIPASRIRKYESGELPVPMPELEILSHNLGSSISNFSGGQGPVAEWLRQQDVYRQLSEMPHELQEFVSRPINRPYLEIALKLSTMDVHKLRAVAEGLLDITL